MEKIIMPSNHEPCVFFYTQNSGGTSHKGALPFRRSRWRIIRESDQKNIAKQNGARAVRPLRLGSWQSSKPGPKT